MSEFINPFDIPPYPNFLTVGLGEENTVSYTEIRNNGTVDFFDDPLGPAVLTFTPDDLEIVQFLAAHLEHYQEQWKNGGRAQHEKDRGPAQPVKTLPGPDDPDSVPYHPIWDYQWHEDESTIAARNVVIEHRRADGIPVTCNGRGPSSSCPDSGHGLGPGCVWPAHRAKGAFPIGMEDHDTFTALVERQTGKSKAQLLKGTQWEDNGGQPVRASQAQQPMLIDGVQAIARGVR